VNVLAGLLQARLNQLQTADGATSRKTSIESFQARDLGPATVTKAAVQGSSAA